MRPDPEPASANAAPLLIGITGATGFVGAAIVDLLLAHGSRVRTLVRSPTRLNFTDSQVEIVVGDLDDQLALGRFVDGLDHVVHCAGLTHARHKEAFFRVNVDGAARLAAAFADRAMPADRPKNRLSGRFVHISSLAARQPSVSTYARSKFDSEAAVALACQDIPYIILRAPAMYGPRDTATLPFFTGVKNGFAPIPGGAGEARASILYVEDFAKAVLTALTAAPTQRLFEVGDEQPDGHSWRQIAMACAAAQNVNVRIVPLPKPVLLGWAAVSSRALHFVGKSAMVTPEKIAEFFHPDWAARENLLTTATTWRVQTPLQQGFQLTSAWYRAHGLL